MTMYGRLQVLHIIHNQSTDINYMSRQPSTQNYPPKWETSEAYDLDIQLVHLINHQTCHNTYTIRMQHYKLINANVSKYAK